MLNLYRRHREEGKCAGGHPVNSRSYESDEQRRNWKKCACPIYASGTLAGAFKRKNLEASLWEQAKPIAAALESANSWDGSLPIAQNRSESPDETAKPDSHGKPVTEVIARWLSEHEKQSAPNTFRKYRYLMAKFQKFADEKGYRGIACFDPADVREFRDSWGVSLHTQSKLMSAVKGFFEFSLENEWIERNPARRVKPPRGMSGSDKRNEQKLPFTDEEIARMLDACANLYGKREIKWDRDVHHSPAVNTVANYKFSWTGEDLADFITVSCYTGLRISDVCAFHIDRLQGDACRVQTKKNGVHVYQKLPLWLVERIEWRAEKHGSLIFGGHQTTNPNVWSDLWRRKLNRLWTLCGPWKEKPTPHRFRHTFARMLLQTPGVSLRDVAEALGDTEEIVRKHYAAWVPERQARLDSVMEKAAKHMPIPAYLQKEEPRRIQ